MSRNVALVSAALALVAGAGSLVATAATDAGMNGTVGHRGSTLATTALYAPSSLQAAAVGHDVALSWPAGRNGDAYRILGGPATGPSCTGVTLAPVATATATSHTDTGRYTPQGSWWCYQAQTSYGPWTSVTANPTTAVQLGVVATSVVIADGGRPGRIDTGDTITVTFNQAIDPASGPAPTDTVCTDGTATVLLGAVGSSGACTPGGATRLGALTGGRPNRPGRWSASYRWSAGGAVLTVTLGPQTAGRNVNDRGTWRFEPTTDPGVLRSAVGGHRVCDTNVGGGTCLPAATGGF